MADAKEPMEHFQELLRLEPWHAPALSACLEALAAGGEPWEAVRLGLERWEWYPEDAEVESVVLAFLGKRELSEQLSFIERLVTEGRIRHAHSLHALLTRLHPSQPDLDRLGEKLAAFPCPTPLVSAIVSTYNSEAFIRGCLEDLEAQTIRDQLEILVIDSASPQDERRIVGEFQQCFGNIKYVRTKERETVYQAWNRGVGLASGRYLTNANTDDRHRPDAFERMVQALEDKPEIALVYADVLITETENETMAQCTPIGMYRWHDWDRRRLLFETCFMGPQPMWRRSLHDEYGLFDASFVTSGDYEFWLRVSQTNDFHHLPECLGLYLMSPGSIEHSNRDRQAAENERIYQLYRTAYAEGTLVRRHYLDDPEQLLGVHNRKAEALFEQGRIQAAKTIFEQILALRPELVDPLNNLGTVFFQLEDYARAVACFKRVLELEPRHADASDNLAQCYVALGELEAAKALLLASGQPNRMP